MKSSSMRTAGSRCRCVDLQNLDITSRKMMRARDMQAASLVCRVKGKLLLYLGSRHDSDWGPRDLEISDSSPFNN